MMCVRNKLVFPIKDFPLYTVYIACIYFFFIEYWSRLMSSSVSGILFVGCVVGVYIVYSIVTNRFKLRMQLHWLCSLLVVLLSSHTAIAAGKFYWCAIFFVLTFQMMVLSGHSNWTEGISGVFMALGNLHVFATIIMWLFSPTLYNHTLFYFWGGAPGGVDLGTAYKAGISSHYSTNGIYCAVMVLFYASEILACGSGINKIKKKTIFFLLASILALLLTTKRAHLLFSICAIIAVYFFVSRGNKIVKMVKIIVTVGFGCCVVVLLSPVIPIFEDIIERFVGSGDISTGRFDFWKQAYTVFESNKLFGIGWGQYQYINRYGTGVHNTYLQLLCETGIVGFLVFLTAMFRTYVYAIKDYYACSRDLNPQKRTIFMWSIATQSFVLLYCFTGNCFYDLTVVIYYLACSVSLSFHSSKRKM